MGCRRKRDGRLIVGGEGIGNEDGTADGWVMISFHRGKGSGKTTGGKRTWWIVVFYSGAVGD